ncbi:hypothetical protein ACP70R_009649 [Stipagrostis hirtigluma subsp. patula]
MRAVAWRLENRRHQRVDVAARHGLRRRRLLGLTAAHSRSVGQGLSAAGSSASPPARRSLLMLLTARRAITRRHGGTTVRGSSGTAARGSSGAGMLAAAAWGHGGAGTQPRCQAVSRRRACCSAVVPKRRRLRTPGVRSRHAQPRLSPRGGRALRRRRALVVVGGGLREELAAARCRVAVGAARCLLPAGGEGTENEEWRRWPGEREGGKKKGEEDKGNLGNFEEI